MNQPTPYHRYYCYGYFDPRPEHAGEAIYVGKGTHDGGRRLVRMEHHWEVATEEFRNKLFGRVLKKIRRMGLEPIRVVLSWHETEEEAFEAEILAIMSHGLRCKKDGTLCNLTYGGEGPAGMEHGAESRKKIGDASLRNWANEDYVARRKKSHAAAYAANPEMLAKRAVEVHNRPEVKISKSKKMKAVCATPEAKARLGGASKKAWSDPAYRAKITEFQKQLWATPERKAARGATMKRLWADPEYRANQKAKREVTRAAKLAAAEAAKKSWKAATRRAAKTGPVHAESGPH